jgi:hypothetical protein
MSNDVEELLRGGMRRATAGVRMAPDLAGQMTRRAASANHKRRLRAWAATTAGAAVAAVTGFAVAGAMTVAPAASGGPRAQTVAYVVSRIDRALDGLGGRPVLADFWRLQTGSLGHLKTWGASWYYAPTATERVVASDQFSPSGHIIVARRNVMEYAGQGMNWNTLTVNYQNRTWFASATYLPRGRFGGQPSCQDPTLDGLTVSGADLRALVKCGDYIAVARQRVDGGEAIELVPSAVERGKSAPIMETVWVNASTYLPVRVLIVGPGGAATEVDVRWLPTTPANLGHLTLRIPPGFKHISAP